MDWQRAVSLFIVVTAAAFLLWSRLRRRRPGPASATLCGCGSGARPSTGSMVCHARKGERPRILVRFR